MSEMTINSMSCEAGGGSRDIQLKTQKQKQNETPGTNSDMKIDLYITPISSSLKTAAISFDWLQVVLYYAATHRLQKET